jgi:NAD(P)-dependent dehydrogenase (short-subunit alcohol dehydrogenase family)
MDPAGLVWIVTGGKSGLGAAVVQALDARKAYVAVLDLNASPDDNQPGANVAHFQCDAGDEPSVKHALEGVKAHWKGKKWGGLCHAAGVGMAGKTIGNDGQPFSFDVFQEVHRINLLGSFLMASNVAAVLAAQGGTIARDADPSTVKDRGVIVLTSSVSATEGQMGQVAYGSSKAAVEGLVLPMARDLARYGIRVMNIAPSLFSTAMGKGTSDKVRASLLAGTLHPPRFGEAREFAQLALAIIENGYLNGGTIRIDGGGRMAKA